MSLFIEAVLVLLVIVVIRFAVKRWNGNNDRERCYPPFLPSLPLVGSLPFLRNFNNIGVFLMQKSFQLGPIFSFQAGGKYVLVLNSKEAIEEALVKNSRTFSSRPEMFIEMIGNRNKKGIAFPDSTPSWKRTHKVALTIFKELGYGVKNAMEELILTEVESMTDFVLLKAGQAFDPHELCLMMSSNVMTTVMFGYRRDYDLGVSNFIAEIKRFMTLLDHVYDIAPVLRYIPPFSRKITDMIDLSRGMYATIDGEIELSLKNHQNNSFVRRYVEMEGPEYDREGLNYLLRDMMTGGTDTIAETLEWAFATLADHQEVQTKLSSEIDSVLPKGRLPTLQDEGKLPYVAATSLELMRYRTLVPLSLLRSTSSDTILSGYYIPSNTTVITNLHAAQNDPRFWKDPEVFRPERFLDEANNVINRDRIITFGLGRRSCFGESLARAEIFLFLTSFIQRFIVLPPEGQEKVDVKPILPVSLNLIPQPYSIRIIERR